MLKLFTKFDVAQMINQGLTFKQIQEKMGFENIGQGWGYKSQEAWLLGQYKHLEDKYICYIPEYCYEDNSIKQIDIDSLYTVKDFKDLCHRTSHNPEDLFESVDWQHPSSLLMEWDADDEVDGNENKDIKRTQIFWTNKISGLIHSQAMEYETEKLLKIREYKREIPKEIIGDKNKSYYGYYYFWTEEDATEAINEYWENKRKEENL